MSKVDEVEAQRQKKYPPSLQWWFFCTTFLCLLTVGTYMACHSVLGSVDTGSEYVRWFYMRGDLYDTRHVSVANLVFYFLMSIYGHVYVNVCNVNCSRKSVFHSSYPNSTDFKITVALAPLFFFAGNNVALRATTDIPGGYSWEECFSYNMAFWFTGYLIGLHYTHAKRGFMDDFSYSADKMALWDWKLKVAGVVVLGIYLFAVFFTLSRFLLIGCGTFQAIICLVVYGPLFAAIYLKRKTHSFHFHHYFGAMMVLPLLWIPHPYTTFNTGFAAGVMVEGAARWGYDSIWVPRNPPRIVTQDGVQSTEREGPPAENSQKAKKKQS